METQDHSEELGADLGTGTPESTVDAMRRRIQELEQQNEALRRDYRSFQAALMTGVKIGQALAASQDEAVFLHSIVALLQKSFGFDGVVLKLVDPAGEALVCQAVAGQADDLPVLGSRQPLDQGAAGAVLQTGKTSLVKVLHPQSATRLPTSSGLKTVVEFPLISETREIGVLSLWSSRPSVQVRPAIPALEALGQLIATIIEQGRLRAELEHTQTRQQQNEHLTLLGQMAVTAAHEMRNPLMGVRLGLEYLLRGISPTDPRHQGGAFMRLNVERLTRIAEDIMYVANPPPLDLRPGRLKPVVEQEVARWQEKLALKGIRLHLALADELPLLMLDCTQMSRALGTLLSNRLEVIPSGGELRLTLRAEGKRQVLTLTDNGAGFPAELLPQVFEPVEKSVAPGMSLGLFVVRDIIERQRGQISIWSDVGAGARFTVTLPA